MTTDTQPQSNDHRKRIARPIFVWTIGLTNDHHADDRANAYSAHVADQGGEVISITPYAASYAGDYGAEVYHFRVVAYRAASPITETP